MIDYHIHTVRCCHAVGTMEEYLAEAEAKGLLEVGFADHFPLGMLDYTPRNQVTMEPSELEDYFLDVERMKKLFPSLSIKLGIEIDFLPGKEQKIEELVSQYPFDYVIGSIHFMGTWDFTHPVYAETYRERDIDQLYDTYFSIFSDLCRSRLFDIVGHLDVIKKFGYRPDRDLDPLWRMVAAELKETGTAFELNTAGRDAPVKEFYPTGSLLTICSAAGVPVTLGSDAHSPDQVGRYFPEALKLLTDSGYRELTVFNRRQAAALPLHWS